MFLSPHLLLISLFIMRLKMCCKHLLSIKNRVNVIFDVQNVETTPKIDLNMLKTGIEIAPSSVKSSKKPPLLFGVSATRGGLFTDRPKADFFWGFLARFTWENTSETLQKHNFRRVNHIREGAFSTKKNACGGLHSQQCSIYNFIQWSISIYPSNFNLQAAIAFSTHAQNASYTVLKLLSCFIHRWISRPLHMH